MDYKHFTTQPASRPHGTCDRDRRLRITTEPWNCWWEYRGIKRVLTVPAGTVWDTMSVPRWAVSVSGIYPGGMGDAGSLPHDELYRTEGGAKPSRSVLSGDPAPVTRKEADWVLREFMKDAGFWVYRANVAYAAVRIGGRKHWGGPTPKTR